MATYLQKHKFANFCVFNRTFANAEKLAKQLNGKAFSLNELTNHKTGFDVLVVCTASTQAIVNADLYASLLINEKSKKVVIDLGLPANVDLEVIQSNDTHYININALKQQADANLELRKNEVVKCEELIRTKIEQFKAAHKERKIELAFGEIPRQVKAIRDLAVQEIFAKEINLLDNQSKEVLDKVLAYVEKKYNAVAIKTAKEVLLNQKN
jgi:glutamyl-tRNA reductase